MSEGNVYEIPIYLKPVAEETVSQIVEESAVVDSRSATEIPTANDRDKQQAAAGSKSNVNAAKALARQIAGKAVSLALNNYGNITGDYVTQQNLQAIVGEATAIYAAAALGPAGITMYAVNKGIELYNYFSGLKRSEREAEFKQQRVYANNKA